MNYEEKYKQALERASKLRVQNPFDTVGQMVEHIFPELKESEDEVHRNWVLEYLYDGLRKADEQFKPQFESAITWLEKQAEHKQTWEPDEAQLIVIKDLIEDKITSKVNKVILRGMLDEFKQYFGLC